MQLTAVVAVVVAAVFDRKLVESCPWDISLREMRSESYLTLGEPAKAISDLKAATKLMSDNTAAFMKLSRLYYGLGEAEESLAQVRPSPCPSRSCWWPSCSCPSRNLEKTKKLDKLAMNVVLGTGARVPETGPGPQGVLPALQESEEGGQTGGQHAVGRQREQLRGLRQRRQKGSSHLRNTISNKNKTIFFDVAGADGGPGRGGAGFPGQRQAVPLPAARRRARRQRRALHGGAGHPPGAAPALRPRRGLHRPRHVRPGPAGLRQGGPIPFHGPSAETAPVIVEEIVVEIAVVKVEVKGIS